MTTNQQTNYTYNTFNCTYNEPISHYKLLKGQVTAPSSMLLMSYLFITNNHVKTHAEHESEGCSLLTGK